MKNKLKILFYMMVTLLVLSLSLTGCSDKTENSSDDTDKNKQEISKEESTNKLDTNLEGAALLESIKYELPKSLIMETELKGSGFTSTSTTYYSGENSRIETDTPGVGKQITIYNAKEGKTYEYTEGEKTGILITDGEEDVDMEGEMESTSIPSFKDLVDESTENVVARVETLDGEEVIFMETTQAEEGMGEATVHMWYSAKYCVPLKYEMLMNGNVMMSSVVKDIKSDTKIKDDMFTPPSDIDFKEYDLDSLW
ncbi:hypothetical protein [Anaerovorax odorimutans]|uniref:hypothetical protein n=1 Tax=Anaerovorax odorimutans TaxID=109327 RepID=UPI000408E904|nr:hypothetical protein [Anaerovorax odorimutans]